MSADYNKEIKNTGTVDFSNFTMDVGIKGYNNTLQYKEENFFEKTGKHIRSVLDLSEYITDNLDETVTEGKVENNILIRTDPPTDPPTNPPTNPPTQAPQRKKRWWEKLGDALASAGATIVVAATSVVSGIADVAEAVVDGGIYVASKAVGLVSKDGEKAMKEFISRDLVGEANKALYEKTEIGKAINEASAMKYDSELAQGIRSVAEDATVFVASTALTVCTGGAAAPLTLSLGAAHGMGNAAEDTYAAHGTDTSTMQELMILANGGLGALSWYTSGKLGKGLINIAKDIGKMGAKEVISHMLKGIFSKETLKELLKPGNIVGNAIGTLMQAGGDIGRIATKLYNGIDVTPEEWMLLVGELIVYFGLNVAEDVFSDNIMNYDAPKVDIDKPKTPDEEIEVLDEIEDPKNVDIKATSPYESMLDTDVRNRIIELQQQAKKTTDAKELEQIESELGSLNQALVKKIHAHNNATYEGYIQDVINKKVADAKKWSDTPLTAKEIELITEEAEEVAANTIANIERLRTNGIFKDGVTTEDLVKLIQSDVDPKTYLSQKGIDAWENDFGIKGKNPDDRVTVYVFQDTSNNYCVVNENGKNFNGNLGRDGNNGGAFVISDNKIDELINEGIINPDGSVTDVAALNKELGANYTGPMVLIGVDAKVSDLSLPRGNNQGAYLGEWCPGGMTSGGIYEAVIPATGDYTIITDSRTVIGG